MKKGLYITFSIIVVIAIVICFVMTSYYQNNYLAYKGSIAGTNFIIQQSLDAGKDGFDADKKGNLYFPINSPNGTFVDIYDNNGDYLYSLPIKMDGGAISLKVDEKDNIMVYDVRAEAINVYDQTGALINTIDDKSNIYYSDFFNTNYEIEKSNGAIYKIDDGKIIEILNGITKVIYQKPIWQNNFEIYNLILILSIIALFLLNSFRFIIPWNQKRIELKRQRLIR